MEDVLNMTIGEMAQTDLKIKLGSDKGSSFIFCGYAKDMNIENTELEIVETYNRTLNKSRSRCKSLTSKTTTFDSFSDEMKRKRKSYIRRNANPENIKLRKQAEKAYPITDEAYADWKKKIEKSIDRAKQTIKTTTERLKKFTPLCDRKIVEIYPSIDEENTYIVIFDGYENGRYWTTKEYESGIVETEEE